VFEKICYTYVKQIDMNTNNKLPSFTLLFEQAVSLYTKNMRMSIVVALLPAIFLATIDIIRPSFAATPFSMGFLFALEVICFVIYFVVVVTVPYMLVRIADMSMSGKTPATIDDLFTEAYPQTIPLFVVSILLLVMTIGASTLYIIPVLILFCYLVFTASVFVIEKKCGFDVFVQSAWYVSGNFWAIAGRSSLLFLVFVGFAVALTGTIAIPFSTVLAVGPITNYVTQLVISLFWLPVSTNFYVLMYKALNAQKSSTPDQVFSSRAKKIFVTLAATTVIVYVILVAKVGYTFSIDPVQDFIKQSLISL
jgi:hypothetical protein